ncbi:flagellar motor protein MotB [Cognatilysobacter bugurensis]|uniref:Flagellar motor protein MotB n=1 Tax=Cognatilysobacter bugurensis TaxID=543356 RepID=A0A918W600_9GAMM|nr:flagellar motor protein MotB [Lysobacter bugurensis]GHA68706.1 flagellar motor protein MotB [Lysobacter bugurensis]
MASEKQQPIIIVRKKKGGSAHHGGAWKVAYADFVTAMMAFFMVMWLTATMTPEQLGGVADYFKNPSAVESRGSATVEGRMGPGGAGDAPIKVFEAVKNPPGAGSVEVKPDAKAAEEQERKRLEELKKLLEEAISKSLAMAPFKDQLLIDLTPEGLRVQIVDAQNRPMFDLGSPELKPHTRAILFELGRFFNQVDNRIAISGHTDTTPYAGGVTGYSNWELSAERANAARRALVRGGLAEEKLSRIVGLSSSVLFDQANSRNPINRRISIVVLNPAAERSAEASDRPRVVGDGRPTDPPPLPLSSDAAALARAPTAVPARPASVSSRAADAGAGLASPE